ncbi:DUF305 domain-containing protein [Sinomonas sp. ASV322]|uniref:DUF305 domain-containing protein n=1 Tax=Sinomonas sp. ASV322 TaxID=3041920 RepID=UPI0027DDE4DB|nr:DUF305 domain-containing protein [Sinomonas sp. ASV322]MDQ4503413.1 DUF305 domain-containing protein [Sinomonas sp. ASV322]
MTTTSSSTSPHQFRARGRLALVGGLAVVGLALAGCGASASDGKPTSGSDAHAGHSMPTGSTSAAPTGAFNSADSMFAQMMIPHHEQAVEMSDLVLAKPGLDSRVSALAQQIKGAQAPEIATLKGWLTGWGQPLSMPSSSGHSMEGMMTDADLAELKSADAATASKLFLAQMIAHHEGAVQMAQTEKASGRYEGAVAMAGSIVSSQTKEIADMKGLLAGM